MRFVGFKLFDTQGKAKGIGRNNSEISDTLENSEEPRAVLIAMRRKRLMLVEPSVQSFVWWLRGGPRTSSIISR